MTNKGMPRLATSLVGILREKKESRQTGLSQEFDIYGISQKSFYPNLRSKRKIYKLTSLSYFLRENFLFTVSRLS